MKHVAVALARSKPGPLSVYFQEYGNPHVEPRRFLGAIKGHADRLKVLDLNLDSLESVDASNSLFAKVFRPQLETLQISLSGSGRAATWPEISFFKGPWHDTLQHLSLHGVRLPPGGYGELRGLRSLMLTPNLGEMIRNTAEILRALSNSPSLEHLWIDSLAELGGDLSVGTANLVTPVRMDRLREITLRLPPASLRAVLRSILPIKLIRVDIETTMPQGNKQAWTEVLLTNEIQPFVHVVGSVVDSAGQIFIQVYGRQVELWTGSKNHANHEYKAPHTEAPISVDQQT
ncbi:hypothetical protein FRC00_001393 [Tulasnella sp. 408]|nr:hypothetical protein FRC00_001393 [Tulasnella sp. 408]